MLLKRVLGTKNLGTALTSDFMLFWKRNMFSLLLLKRLRNIDLKLVGCVPFWAKHVFNWQTKLNFIKTISYRLGAKILKYNNNFL